MKTNFFKRAATLLLSAGLILTTACSDNVPGGENGGDDNSQYEKGYIALSVINATAKSALSKANPGTVTATGTDDEKKVNSMLVVLYSAATDIVDYQFELGTNDIVETTTYQTKAKEVAKKDYKLAVFVNPSAAIKTATAKGENVSKIMAAKTLTNGALDLIKGESKNDNFLMSNMEGLVAVAEAKIKNTAAEAENAPVKLYVERAVAKLSIARASADDFKTALNATVGAITWDVDVVNKSTYWMRKQAKMLEWNYTSNPGATTGNLIDEVAYDNTKDDRVLRYAEDPNFTGYSWEYWNSKESGSKPYTEPSVKPGATGGPFVYLTEVTTALPVLADGVNPAAVYIPENTMAADEQWEDVTTSVVFKVAITPKGTALVPTKEDIDAYYVYKGLVFTQNELAEIYADIEATNKATNIAGTSSSWAELVTANPLLAGLQDELEKNKATLGGSSQNYSATPNASAKAGEIKFFAAGGLNYYNVPIRHYSNDLQPTNMGYGRFGVVRNNVYQLTLNSINNYGDITIPEKKNPDETESWLSVEFTILPWVVRSNGIDL